MTRLRSPRLDEESPEALVLYDASSQDRRVSQGIRTLLEGFDVRSKVAICSLDDVIASREGVVFTEEGESTMTRVVPVPRIIILGNFPCAVSPSWKVRQKGREKRGDVWSEGNFITSLDPKDPVVPTGLSCLKALSASLPQDVQVGVIVDERKWSFVKTDGTNQSKMFVPGFSIDAEKSPFAKGIFIPSRVVIIPPSGVQSGSNKSYGCYSDLEAVVRNAFPENFQ